MTSHSLPTRALPPHPDLEQLKRQAKELLESFVSGEASAAAEVTTHYHDADPATFALHDAQLVLARAYGFESWPKLKAAVEGVTIDHLTEAVRARDLSRVRSMLRTRPELARKGADNYSPLHFAVMNRDAEMVRVLMQHGASARQGVYPYGETTSALTLASDDAKTGAHLWHFETQEIWKSSPMTYLVNGRQYVAIVSGANVLAFALP